MSNLCKWKREPAIPYGIICGCDRVQEWLLPWWWERYHEHNTLPVTFIDFGMTQSSRSFCREKGELITIDLDDAFIKTKQQIDQDTVSAWEAYYGENLWPARLGWFKKPFAFLTSSYKTAIWLDLDCEVLGPIDALLSYCDVSPLALVREFTLEHLPYLHPEVRYNGGVVVFQHASEIIQQWAEAALEVNHLFSQDDILLSALIYRYQIKVAELPKIYNWRIVEGVNPNAIIFHWVGKKNYIRVYGGIKPAMQIFLEKGKNAGHL